MFDRAIPFVGIVLFCAALVATLNFPSNIESISTDEENGPPDTFSYQSRSASSASSAPTTATNVWDSADGHTLTRGRDGHFYASARIDGRDVNMMVDTGASVIALTGRDASAIGLRWNESDVGPVARGASGTVYGVRTRLREVEIGGMKRQNVSAMIIPRGLDVSLLGQSYLSQIGTVEITGNEMVLSED